MHSRDLCIRRLAADTRGFTLVEILVALLMAFFFASATLGIVSHSSKVYRAQERISDSQQDVRAALDLMVHDTRMAGYDPMRETTIGGRVAGVLTATATAFRFTMDLDASRTIDANAWEDIMYSFNAATNQVVMTLDGNNNNPLIQNVTAMAFTYLDEDGNVLPDPAPVTDIRRVVIRVQTQNRANTQGEVFNRTLTTNINSRNMNV